MATTPTPNDYNIPGLSQQPFTSDGKAASAAFIRIWQQMRTAVITALNGIQGQVTSLTAITQRLDSQQAQILAQNAVILVQQAAINQALGLAQIAQATANTAQSSADAAGGGTERSGSATDPSVDLFGTGWITGPQVSLTGVVAGNLTITGSGPQQDADVAISGSKNFSGKYRIVEIIGGIDGTTWEFNFTAIAPDFDLATINNTDAGAVAAFSVARVSVGAVDYRIDAQRTSGGNLNDLTLYIYVRRA